MLTFKQLKQFADLKNIEIEVNPVYYEDGTLWEYEIGLRNPYSRNDWRCIDTWYWFTTLYEPTLTDDSELFFRNRYSCQTGRNTKQTSIGTNLTIYVLNAIEAERETEQEAEQETEPSQAETAETALETNVLRYFELEKELIQAVRERETDNYVLIANNMGILKQAIKNQLKTYSI